jgi:hypothetical protein
MRKAVITGGLVLLGGTVAAVLALGMTAAICSAFGQFIGWCILHGGFIVGMSLGIIAMTLLLKRCQA